MEGAGIASFFRTRNVEPTVANCIGS